jgi:hypothetical protein
VAPAALRIDQRLHVLEVRDLVARPTIIPTIVPTTRRTADDRESKSNCRND